MHSGNLNNLHMFGYARSSKLFSYILKYNKKILNFDLCRYFGLRFLSTSFYAPKFKYFNFSHISRLSLLTLLPVVFNYSGFTIYY